MVLLTSHAWMNWWYRSCRCQSIFNCSLIFDYRLAGCLVSYETFTVRLSFRSNFNRRLVVRVNIEWVLLCITHIIQVWSVKPFPNQQMLAWIGDSPCLHHSFLLTKGKRKIVSISFCPSSFLQSISSSCLIRLDWTLLDLLLFAWSLLINQGTFSFQFVSML